MHINSALQLMLFFLSDCALPLIFIIIKGVRGKSCVFIVLQDKIIHKTEETDSEQS